MGPTCIQVQYHLWPMDAKADFSYLDYLTVSASPYLPLLRLMAATAERQQSHSIKNCSPVNQQQQKQRFLIIGKVSVLCVSSIDRRDAPTLFSSPPFEAIVYTSGTSSRP